MPLANWRIDLLPRTITTTIAPVPSPNPLCAPFAAFTSTATITATTATITATISATAAAATATATTTTTTTTTTTDTTTTTSLRRATGGKPQYVIDQENGISRLQPKYYEPTAHRWKPLPQLTAIDATEGTDGANGTDGAADEDTLGPMQPLDELTCVTYNVWFDKRNQHARALALFEILRASQAHVISLQGNAF